MVLRARLSSVPPSMGSSRSFGAKGLPSYAAPHGNYFLSGSSARASSMAPTASVGIRASSVAPGARIRASSVAPQSSFIRASSVTPLSSSRVHTVSRVAPHYEPLYAPRRFGSKLGSGYTTVTQKPAIYDEYYGTSYIPSGGRDSWSAYRISDETLDDNDELAYQSKKRDFELMKDVNRTIQYGPRMRNRLHQMGLLARYGSAFDRPAPTASSTILRHNPPRPAVGPSRLPPKPAIVTIRGGQRPTVAQTAGKVQGFTDWPVPRVIRRAMPSADAKLINARLSASKARATSVPPLSRPPARAGSVPPVNRKFIPAPVPRVVKSQHPIQVNKMIRRGVKSTNVNHVPGVYNTPQPKVQVRYSTVERGSDLLHPRYRLWSREEVDLENPRTMLDMRARLANAKNMMENQKSMLAKYNKGDPELTEVDSELKAIKAIQTRRAQSVIERSVAAEKKGSERLRRRLRETVLRSRLGSHA